MIKYDNEVVVTLMIKYDNDFVIQVVWCDGFGGNGGDSDIVARGSDGNDNCGCFSGGNSNDNNYDCGSSNGNVKSNSGTMRKIILLEFIIDTFFMKFETPGFGYG